MQIKSFYELKGILNSLGCPYPGNQGDFFFRGLPDENFNLLPPLFYPPSPDNAKDKEVEILNRFIKATSLGKNLGNQEIIWQNAFYARHWGLKLRLIDWTIDLSTALYFMHQGPNIQNIGALFIFPKRNVDFKIEIPDISYFDYSQTTMLNPPFRLDDIELIGSKNRFVQNGRFLVQSYDTAGTCFYKRNFQKLTKIAIPQIYLKNIYEECCKEHNYDPNIPLLIKADTDMYYKLCEEINNI